MAKKRRLALRQRYDGYKIRAVIDWCEASGLPVERCTYHQLRIGPWNYWPETGVFRFEAEPASPMKGFDAFKTALSAWIEKERSEYGKTLGD